MSDIIIGQVRFLLMTSLLGMALMAAYDVCRFFRWLIPHPHVVVILGDIFFWMLMSLPAYGLFFIFNDGEIRWYGALAVFLGGLLYEKGISAPLRRLGDCYLTRPKRKIFRFIRLKGRKGAEGIKKGMKKIRKKGRNFSKKSCKKSKNSI